MTVGVIPFLVDFEEWPSKEKLHELKAHGVKGVIGYLSPTNFKKTLTPQRVQDATDAGLLIFSVFEWGARDVLGGAKEGGRDGALAQKVAKACGQPSGRPIFYAVDFQDRSLKTTREYLRAAQDKAPDYPAGDYADFAVVEALKDEFSWAFQTAAWSEHQISDAACIYQAHNGVTLCGITVDEDRILKPDFGGWSH